MTIEAIKLRKWGHSLGIVVPQKIVKQYRFKDGEKVDIIIRRKTNILKETFGTAKFKKSTEQMLKESDRLLYND